MVEAMFYVLRTAVAWRDLPACYGPWNSVYTRWRRWCALGLWQEILRMLSRRAEGRVRFIDGSHVKCHQFATNPAGGQDAQAIGRTKGGLNTKICALVEGQGRLMAAAIAPGQTYEVEASAPLLETLRRVLLVGDKGFDSDALRRQMLAQGCLASVPHARGGVLRPGFIGVSIGSGIRSKTSSNASKSISVSPPVMKNSPSLF